MMLATAGNRSAPTAMQRLPPVTVVARGRRPGVPRSRNL